MLRCVLSSSKDGRLKYGLLRGFDGSALGVKQGQVWLTPKAAYSCGALSIAKKHSVRRFTLLG